MAKKRDAKVERDEAERAGIGAQVGDAVSREVGPQLGAVQWMRPAPDYIGAKPRDDDDPSGAA